MGTWVDYKEIKSKITIEMVLEHYDLLGQMKTSGQSRVGRCPIHKGGNPRAFSVSIKKNLWHCFGDCKTGGNILDLVSMIEYGNKEPESIRKAAILLSDWFLDGGKPPVKKRPDDELKKDAETPAETERVSEKHEKTAEKAKEKAEKQINSPLTFTLKSLETDHSFFRERGIDPETAKHFGLGFCKRGLMKNRIAIPIHDHQKNLVAYCGRAVSDEQIERKGKYKLPPKFAKQEVVYNLHRQLPNSETQILVESYISVWKLHQAGFPYSVALMGSSLGKTQEKLILGVSGASGKLILLFDADQSGRACGEDCLKRLGFSRMVRAVDLAGYGWEKPHQMSEEDLKSVLTGVITE